MVTIENLKGFKIFKHLNERELEQVVNIAEETVFDAGIRIFEEKALAVNLYLVLEGKVELKISSGDSLKQVIIDQAGPGEIFGWSAVTEPHTFTAAAWTVEKSKLIVLSSAHLNDLFEKNNHIGYRIIKEIATVATKRVKALESRLVEAMHTKG